MSWWNGQKWWTIWEQSFGAGVWSLFSGKRFKDSLFVVNKRFGLVEGRFGENGTQLLLGCDHLDDPKVCGDVVAVDSC